MARITEIVPAFEVIGPDFDQPFIGGNRLPMPALRLQDIGIHALLITGFGLAGLREAKRLRFGKFAQFRQGARQIEPHFGRVGAAPDRLPQIVGAALGIAALAQNDAE